jgi:dihydrofolate synthase/folylpolyglutamate synthase
MLASILQEAGYKAGLYTSPHLKDFRERIKINGQEIAEDFVVDFIVRNQTFFEDHSLSFFEMTVGLAFDYFDKQNVDIAVIEVGMGGRLDSTNIITPLVSVITNIGFDHTQFLGATLDLIAAEKAGIIKTQIPAVIGEYTAETKPVFEAKADEQQAPIYFASETILEDYPSALKGNYQFHNKKTVLQTIRILQQTGFQITEHHIKQGLQNVIRNTGLLGRWQQLQQNPTVIADTAHNKAGLEMTMHQISGSDFDQLHLVIGVVNDKDLDELLPLFPKNAHYYFCKPNLARGLDATILSEKAASYGLHGTIYDSVPEAYQSALQNAGKHDFIYVGGSTFVVAEIL